MSRRRTRRRLCSRRRWPTSRSPRRAAAREPPCRSGRPAGSAHGQVVSTPGRDSTTNPATADAYRGGEYVPFGQENHSLGEKGKRGEMPGASDVRMQLSYKQLVEVIPSGKPATISGTETFQFKDSSGYDITGGSMIRITFGIPDAPAD